GDPVIPWRRRLRCAGFLVLGMVKPETDQLEGWRVAQPQRYANSRSACEFGDHLFGEQVDAGTVVGRVSEVADRVAETEVADLGKPLSDLLGRADYPLGLDLRQLRL